MSVEVRDVAVVIRDHFTNAIRVNDHYAEAFYNRGVAYALSGDRKSAEKDYRQALTIMPTFKLAKDKLSAFHK